MAKKNVRKSRPVKKPMNLFLLILVDLVLIGAALLVFALFHHVIPRQEQAVGIMSQRVSSVITATPVPMATDKPTPEPTSLPTPEPTQEPTQEPTPEPTQEPSEAPVEKVLIAADGGAEDSAAASTIPEITASPEPTPEVTAAPEITATPEVTATPEPAATPAPELVAVDVTRVPTPIPDATPDPVGYFGTKFADKFTDGEVIKTENSYQSANVNVQITNVRDLGTEIYIADIYIKDISCLQTGFAKDTFGRGYAEWLRDMAERSGSVITINGDYCGGRNNGVVIRNGMLYRQDDRLKRDVAVIYWDGTMETFSPDEFDTEAEMARGAYQAWNFGPELLDENGKAMEDFNSSVKPRNPRTAIGYYEPGHYCFVVIDGRSYQSVGMSMKNLSALMESLGCVRAYNLDGGESAEMVFGTERVSVPYKNGRQNSDAVFIMDIG